MTKTTTTVYFQQLINAKVFNTPFVVTPNTTLTEKFAVPGTSENEFKLEYLTIGGSTANVSDEVIDLTIKTHKVIDGALYNHLPLYAVEANMDSMTHDYRLMNKFSKEGIVYNVYYAKKITILPKTNTVSINDDVNDEGIIELSKAVFKAGVQVLDPLSTESLTYNGVVVSTRLGVTVTGVEANAINEACVLLYGGVKRIMEIGLCFGKEGVNDVVDLHLAITNNINSITTEEAKELSRTIELASFDYL